MPKNKTAFKLFKLYDGSLIYSRAYVLVEDGWRVTGRCVIRGQPSIFLQDSFLSSDAVQIVLSCHKGGKLV